MLKLLLAYVTESPVFDPGVSLNAPSVINLTDLYMLLSKSFFYLKDKSGNVMKKSLFYTFNNLTAS